MGKITINEFSDSLRDATVQVGEKLGDIEYEDVDRNIWDLIGNQELKTDDKTITGAINELFQSANNGKQLIATAIGEPLSAEDTFSAMSNDINGLLATFKTNMMNNGVTVESNDKFKQLIDKIATMAEDTNGKGIHYAEGAIGDITFKSTEVSTFTIYNIPINIDFTPTVFFLEYTFHSNPNEGVMIINNVGNNIVSYGSVGTVDKDWSSFYIGNVSSTNCELYYRKGVNSAYKFTDVKYYAIGVGEKDTALRDSLASILENKGVDVTEEDDMASLISKVDTELCNKMLMPTYSSGTDYLIVNILNEMVYIGPLTEGSSMYTGSIYSYTYTNKFSGTIRLTVALNEYVQHTYVLVTHKRNNTVLSTTKIIDVTSDSTGDSQYRDFDVEIGDIMEFEIHDGGAGSDYITIAKLTANINW